MERRIAAEKECMLCRPGGFHMTEELFSMADLNKREEPLTVIDVGCGSGAAMWHLKQKHPSWDICGVEPYPEKEEAETFSGSGLVRLLGRAEKLPLSDASADVILMECSFSKTGDPDRALAESLRVLKPDGWLLLSDMYARKEEFIDPEPAGRAGEQAGGRLLGRLESHKTIWNRLQKAGFSVLEMQDRSGELVQWIGQKMMDGEACDLFKNLGVDREALKQAGCGYYICAARPSGLWRTLAYAVENSPFYRETCGKLFSEFTGENGLTEKHIRPGDWNIFRALPFTTPENIRENPEAFVCVNPKEIARIITLYTSGSKGNPKRIYFTEKDLLRTADFFEKGMQYLITPGESVTVYMEGPGRFSIGGLQKESLSRIGSEVTVHGLIRDMAAAAADGEGKDCFVGVPSQMHGLASYAPWLRPKSVLLSADYVPESVKEFLEKTWECKVFTHWGMTETGYGGGVQCGAREGYHLRDDDLLLEILDPETGAPVKDGEYGELVLTTLHRRGMPLLRYRTGDLGRMLTEPCGCGCLKPRLDKVEGRLDDCMRLSDGTVLSMHVLDELIFAVDGVQDFEAEIAGDRLLRVFVQVRNKMEKSAREAVATLVLACLKERFGSMLQIEVQEKEISPYIGSGKRKLKMTGLDLV
ncbi:MAG: methyltransferase domain-containing protein [Clostridium sp.]|nr:methyltransferase domain-containing protein [Clostridium sp.]